MKPDADLGGGSGGDGSGCSGGGRGGGSGNVLGGLKRIGGLHGLLDEVSGSIKGEPWQ